MSIKEITWHRLFVDFLPIQNLFTHIETSPLPCRCRATNFDLYSALMATEQWGFFSVPRLLWRGASVYNGRLSGPLALTSNSERLAVEMFLHCIVLFLRLKSVAAGIRTPKLPLALRMLLPTAPPLFLVLK